MDERLPAGSVSPEAASLYTRMTRNGPLPLGGGAHEVDPADPALTELINARVARLALIPVRQPDLPAAQREILAQLAVGKTDAAIAAERGQSVRTVRRHISEIMAALQVRSRFAAGVAAVRRGWL
jgi:DNA-binding NarL/FixJ family response regulator